MTNAVIYCRSASALMGQTDAATVEQEKRCRAFAEVKGYMIGGVFVDSGVSGNSTDRAGVQAMLEHLNRNSCDGQLVLIDETSRLGRDLLVYDLLSDAISATGAKLEVISPERIDAANVALFSNSVARVKGEARSDQ